MNTRLLRKVAKHIAEEPRRFIMAEAIALAKQVTDTAWFPGMREPKHITLDPPCGTAACIAGWTCLLTGHKPEEFRTPDGIYRYFGLAGVGSVARAALGITEAQGQKLFHLKNWEPKFRKAFANAKTPKGRAAAANRQIEHFIKTKGRE